MAIYHDPDASDYPHPQLLVDLMARPAKIDLLPLELQVTTVLAWLLDRSRPFALALLNAFLGAEHEADEQAIGARTQVTLPPLPPGGSLFPDLSIDIADRAVQLLIEVKVDATFHTHVLDDGTFLQPDTYVLAWTRATELDGRGEARMRRVGTLSRTPADAPRRDVELGDAHTRRTADISWHTVRDLIDNIASTGGFGEFQIVAQEFREVLEERIFNPRGWSISDPTIAWGVGLLADVLPAVVEQVSGASLGNLVAPQFDYVGRYLRVDFGLASTVQFWIYVTTADGRYNGGRTEANLWLSEHPDVHPGSDVRMQLATAGFSEIKDAAGRTLRRSLPLSRVKASAEPNVEREVAIEWILRSLEQAGAVIGLRDS